MAARITKRADGSVHVVDQPCGGLFELTFAIWLIACGFASTVTAARLPAGT